MTVEYILDYKIHGSSLGKLKLYKSENVTYIKRKYLSLKKKKIKKKKKEKSLLYVSEKKQNKTFFST